MNTVDLHTHSACSDGTFTPKELIGYGKKKGLKAIALTDHDTLEGIQEAVYYGEKYEIEVVPGIEISTEYENIELHIVGLFINDGNSEFVSVLENLRKSRENRNIEMVEKLNQIGVNIKYSDVLKHTEGAIATRAHIAREIIAQGYAASSNEVFDKYIGRDKPAYVKRKVLPWQNTIHLILSSGGLPVLAHPLLYKISAGRLEMIVSDLASHGLVGIEAYYPTHSHSEIKYIKNLAQKNKLELSGGSDFHGANKPKLDLGSGYGNLEVPYEILDNLKKLKGVKNA